MEVLEDRILEDKVEALAEYFFKNGWDLDGADIEKAKQDIRNWGKSRINTEFFLIFDSDALAALHPAWFEEDYNIGEEVSEE